VEKKKKKGKNGGPCHPFRTGEEGDEGSLRKGKKKKRKGEEGTCPQRLRSRAARRPLDSITADRQEMKRGERKRYNQGKRKGKKEGGEKEVSARELAVFLFYPFCPMLPLDRPGRQWGGEEKKNPHKEGKGGETPTDGSAGLSLLLPGGKGYKGGEEEKGKERGEKK